MLWTDELKCFNAKSKLKETINNVIEANFKYSHHYDFINILDLHRPTGFIIINYYQCVPLCTMIRLSDSILNDNVVIKWIPFWAWVEVCE